MSEYPNYLSGVPDGQATGVASIIGPGVTQLGGALYLANSKGGNAQPLTTALVANPIAVASNVITSPTLPSNQGAHMRIIVIARSDTAAETDTLTITFNADTANHYDSSYTQLSHATVSGVNATAGGAAATIGTIAAASATAGIPGIAIIDIPLFHGTTFQKQFAFECGYQDIATAAADVINVQGIGTWRSTAAITSFVIKAGTGNLVAGSVAYVYSS